MANVLGKVKEFLFSKKGIWTLGSLIFVFFVFFMLGGSGSGIGTPVYRIGQDDHWYSLNLMGKEKSMTAFSNHLLRLIANEKGFRFSLVTAPPATLESRLNRGELDAIVTPMAPTSTLEDKYVFSEPYFLMGPVLIVPRTSELHTWEETAYKIIGATEGSATALELKQEFQILLQIYDNPLKALSDLNAGKIDGVILPAMPAYIYVNTFYPKQLRVATAPLNNDGFKLIALKNKRGQEIINAFNEGLNVLRANQDYQDILKQWGFINLDQAPPSSRQ